MRARLQLFSVEPVWLQHAIIAREMKANKLITFDSHPFLISNAKIQNIEHTHGNKTFKAEGCITLRSKPTFSTDIVTEPSFARDSDVDGHPCPRIQIEALICNYIFHFTSMHIL